MQHSQSPSPLTKQKILGGLGIALLVYVLMDLAGPVRTDLRSFDPVEMGKLETAMWKSYYTREPVSLYCQLAEMLRTQYHFPLLRSFFGAYHASRAALRFKDHQDENDLHRTEISLESYFNLIKRTGNLDFDAARAAKLELQWWLIHRQRDKHTESELAEACAEAAAALYGISPNTALPHGKLRAEAMTIRDNGAAAGGVTGEDWTRIENLLVRSYTHLLSAVQRVP